MRIVLVTFSQGPPNAQKTPVSSSTSGLGAAPPGETSYELLLQQQQLFLQWQLEWQHKVPTHTFVAVKFCSDVDYVKLAEWSYCLQSKL